MKAHDLVKGIISGNRKSLSKAITLIESTSHEHKLLSNEILSLLPTQTSSLRLGICGAPGAGKSTLIRLLGLKLIQKNKKPAILAMDPSSTQFGGSILGDKTRMDTLAYHPSAYVRPSPTRGILGGITSTCSEVISLCESAGYNPIIIETVGLGQSETSVDEVSDLVMLVTSPAGGDELQGIKKGVMEIADILVVNKAEKELKSKAKETKIELEMAIALNIRRYPNWTPPTIIGSSVEGDYFEEIIETIYKAKEVLKEEIEEKRKVEREKECFHMVEKLFSVRMKTHKEDLEVKKELEKLYNGEKITRIAAEEIFSLLVN